MIATFENEDTFSIPDGLEVTPVPDGSMIYQSSEDRVHYLNPTATIVFELCGLGKSVAEIETFLSDGFALLERPAEQVAACLVSLTSQGLIVARK